MPACRQNHLISHDRQAAVVPPGERHLTQASPATLPSDGPETAKPPYLDVPHVRVYLIHVRSLPRESASKQRKTVPLIIDRVRLVGDGA
jgi:hypothetical protein